MTDTTEDLPRPFATPETPTLRDWISKLGVAGKALLVGGLALLMLVPLAFVQGVIAERGASQRAATQDIRALWGGAQQITGPMLRIPYRTPETGTTQLVWIMPETLSVTSRLVPEVRYRGLYQTVVYRAEIEISGSFPPIETMTGGSRPRRVDWREAFLTLGIADPRSLLLSVPAQLAGTVLTFEPSPAVLPALATLAAGVQMLAEADTDAPVPFSIRLQLNGSGDLAFLPLARTTEVTIAADWEAPSFFGRFAAEERQIADGAFSARWRITHLGTGLARSYDSFDGHAPAVADFESRRFGVTLMQPIGAHRESERAAKYGLLFVALTLGVWLLFEMVAGVRVHVLQYGLVGAALCVFYLLLLSLAEQIGFASAYACSAAAVVLQTSAYTWMVTRRWKLAAIFAAAVACLYGYLYVLLQLETLSMIGGSALLFAVLSLAMWGTRRLGTRLGYSHDTSSTRPT